MAVSTAAALEAELRTDHNLDAGSASPIQILNEMHDSATYSRYYCVGRVPPYAGKSMWVKTTISGNDGAQADEIRAAMATAGHVDVDAQV